MLYNAQSRTTKVIHEAIQIDKSYRLRCNRNFDPGIDGWIEEWKPVDRPPTCKHCISLKEAEDEQIRKSQITDG
jgi:hypothetical protein